MINLWNALQFHTGKYLNESRLYQTARHSIRNSLCDIDRTHDKNDNVVNKEILCFVDTSLQARYADLPASPVGLLGRFASSGFALRTCQQFALIKIFGKKGVLIDSKCSETHRNEKKKIKSFDPFTKFFKKSVSQLTPKL